jgi:hypothetical protein
MRNTSDKVLIFIYFEYISSLNEPAVDISAGRLYIFRGLTPALCSKHILNHFDRGEGDLKSFDLSVWSEAHSLKLGEEDSLGYECSRGDCTSLARFLEHFLI